MGRYLGAAAVLFLELALLATGPWSVAVPVYALAAVLVVVLCRRSPVGAFAAALVLAALTISAYVVLLWIAYEAGRAVRSRAGLARVIGAALGGLAVQLLLHRADARMAGSLVVAYLVFVALPLLAGRYLAQNERLVAGLRYERELLAGQERLRERLRIARDMHDSLGRRLSLVSMQAAALEVAGLPPEQHEALQNLAGSARAAVTDLHELVGALREPGVSDLAGLVAEFQSAGVAVTLHQTGDPGPLPAGQAAYRMVEEGLTNAAKHAPGQPVTVRADWSAGGLELTITNPLSPDPPAPEAPAQGAGHGLIGLAERIRMADGRFTHDSDGDEFRLTAVLPGDPPPSRFRASALGLATAAMMFVVLPLTMFVGVGGR